MTELHSNGKTSDVKISTEMNNDAQSRESIHRSLHRLFRQLRHTVLWISYFSRFVLREFIARRGLQTASSLAYTTLLSIVPLVGVMFSFFGNLTVFRELTEGVQEFVFGNFVPAFGETIKDYLISFSMKASQLTATGIGILVLIALLMLSTIESAMNHIWNVTTKRNMVGRFLVYWAILTLGPVLVGVGMYFTSYLLALPLVSSMDATLSLKSRLFALVPFFTTALAFTILYILVPNCEVKKRDAIIGAFVAALFFELAKYTFGLYVRAVPTYQMIYGAIAVIPMFLIWIYVSWVVILLGSQIAYCLSVFRLDDALRKRGRHDWTFLDAFQTLAVLWQAQKRGEQLSTLQMRKRGVRIPHLLINQLLDILKRENWVYRTTSGKWILARDISELTLLDLYKVLPRKLPDRISNENNIWEQPLKDVIERQRSNREEALSINLGNLFRQGSNSK